MDAIILAGGYATRLYPLTKRFPKPLLSIGGIPIVERITNKIYEIPTIDRIIISTNSKFKGHFSDWLKFQKDNKRIILHAEQSKNEKEKLGAIAALLQIYDIYDDCQDFLVIAGDNLFLDSLKGFVSFYQKNKESVINARSQKNNLLTVALVKEEPELAKKHRASVILNPNNSRITEFIEKPKGKSSGYTGTGIYALSNSCPKIAKKEYLNQNNNADSPGYLIEWLSKRADFEGYGYVLSQKWWDIGTIESYKDALDYFQRQSLAS